MPVSTATHNTKSTSYFYYFIILFIIIAIFMIYLFSSSSTPVASYSPAKFETLEIMNHKSLRMTPAK